MYLEVNRVANVGAKSHDSWIETLCMTNLQHRPPGFRGGNHLVRFVQSARNGLLDEHMYSRPEKLACDFAMSLSRNSQANRVDPLKHLSPVSCPLDSSFVGNASGGLAIKITHEHKVASAFGCQR